VSESPLSSIRSPSSQGQAPFIGRHVDQSVLQGAFESALSGHPRLVLMAGEAGIGKSRLMREMRPAFEKGATVLLGHCHEGSQAAYMPFVEALNTAYSACRDSAGARMGGSRPAPGKDGGRRPERDRPVPRTFD
jgi:predicted ATPase